MIYSPATAIAELLAAGLGAHQTTVEAVGQRLATAITQAPPAVARGLTLETMFADSALTGKGLAELRRLVGNCALKPEAAISQLRRAQAGFIEAHTAYRDEGHSDLRYTELHFAVLRLGIAQEFYAGLVKALPTASRAVRPVRIPSAVREFTIDDFSEEEQEALELALNDRHLAIRQIEAILAAGRASGDGICVFVGYLMDELRKAEVNRWLTALRRARHDKRMSAQAGSQPNEAADTGNPRRPLESDIAVPTTLTTGAGGRITNEIRSPVPEVMIENASTDTQQMRQAVATLMSWLETSWRTIGPKFQEKNGAIEFSETIYSPKVAEAYGIAGRHPDFQAALRARRSGE